MTANQQNTEQPGKKQASIFYMCLAFFLVFGLGSIISAYFTLWEPYARWQSAQTWKAVPCRITTSEVSSRQELSDDDWVEVYSPNVRYGFEWNGTSRESDIIGISGFRSVSSTNREEWAQVVAKYPPGASATCFVNPGNPAQAALDISFQTTDFLIGAVMSGVFLLAGLLFFFIGRKFA